MKSYIRTITSTARTRVGQLDTALANKVSSVFLQINILRVLTSPSPPVPVAPETPENFNITPAQAMPFLIVYVVIIGLVIVIASYRAKMKRALEKPLQIDNYAAEQDAETREEHFDEPTGTATLIPLSSFTIVILSTRCDPMRYIVSPDTDMAAVLVCLS